MRNLTCKRIQCDEIWSFCYANEKNLPEEKKSQFGYGDVWTWTGTCSNCKLDVSFLVGNRDGETAKTFIEDLKSRLAGRVQLTTDGHKAYLEAVEDAFGADIDYAMLIKIYGTEPQGERRYSPPSVSGVDKVYVSGKPENKRVSTSYVERQNLSMRMSMRRFTRLTNAFSKKVQNLAPSVSLYFLYYNFARIHSTLRITPAMDAGRDSRTD